MKNKILKKTDKIITIILIIGIIVVANYLAFHFFYRWDLTKSNLYSITNSSKQTVANLNDVINIKAYFSKNLPTEVMPVKQELGDILDEYKTYSNGNVNIEFIDPGSDAKLKRQLLMLGIPEVQMQIYEKDKAQVVNGYMGLAITYKDKTEVIPAINQDARDLEYQITTKIKKVTADKIASVGFLSGFGTTENDQLSFLKESLGELYSVEDVDLTEDISPAINTLIVPGPKQELNEDNLIKINNFIMRGGSLIALIDGVNMEQGLQAAENKTNFIDFIGKYGIKVNKDLVADERCGIATFRGPYNLPFSLTYPFWPLVSKDGFNQQYGAVANLKSIIFPWPSSLEKIGANDKIGFLAETSKKAWDLTSDFSGILPNNITQPPAADLKQFNLAMIIEGGIKSAYASSSADKISNSTIVVIGDSDFVNNNFLQANHENLNLMLNLVDSLNLDKDLVNIRAKKATIAPINQFIPEHTKNIIKYANIFALAIIILLIGLLRYYLRKKSKLKNNN